MRFLLSLVLIVFLVSCATPGQETIDDLSVPLNELQKVAISSLPIGKRSESINGREYFSEYFVLDGTDFVAAEDSNQRSTVHITILGDRRPYRLTVRVLVEKRVKSNQFVLVKYDEGLAKMISRKIKSGLHKRRDDRNIIDDFRVF